MTRDEAKEATERAFALVAMCNIVFSGEEPEVIGAAMAELMATFLRSHKIVSDDPPLNEHEMREQILTQWLQTVRDLVLIHDKPAGPMQ
jgi:hypothetical protein